ncbi:MAG: pantoate--beta-alanine ligase [Chloroflexi bacterium OLB14]|nr:MAG: pantoate--beta-alanine ligase [Chloroflexi bacterium OLB14]
MNLISSLSDLRTKRLSLLGTVGLVPTMGYLHSGHLSLVSRAMDECEHVIVTIFVNPTQFGANEDLSKYPRDLERDLNLLSSLSSPSSAKELIVWNPSAETMYPLGYQTWVNVEALTNPLEGAMRPGHFKGVTTVVSKLFNATQPHKAYFGQKDAQQVAVIRRMTLDLNFPIEIVVCPTMREDDGLAMSSRNKYLNKDERTAATILFRSLSEAKKMYEAGERNADVLRNKMKEVLASEPLANVQYVSCADYDSLEELNMIENKSLLSMAVFIGKTRLIDNFVLG